MKYFHCKIYSFSFFKLLLIIIFIINNIYLTSYASVKCFIKDINQEDIDIEKKVLLSNNNALSYYYLGDIYLKENNILLSQQCFVKGLDINPKIPFNMIGLIIIKFINNDPSHEILINDLILKYSNYKKNSEFNIALMKYYFYTKNNEKYILFYNKAIKNSKHKDWNIYIENSKLLILKQSFNEVDNELKKALIYNNFDFKLHYQIGKLMLLINNINLAYYHFNKSIELNDNYTIVYHAIAIIKIKNKDYNEAVHLYNKYYYSLNNINDLSMINYIKLLLLTKNVRKSLDILNEYKKKYNKNLEITRLESYIMYKLKNYNKCKKYLKLLINNNEKLIIEDYIYIIKSYAFLKKQEKCLIYFEYLINNYGLHNKECYKLYDYLIDYYDSLNDYDSSISIIQKKINIYGPKYHTIIHDKNRLGVFMTYIGNYESAYELFSCIIKEDCKNIFAYIMLAQINIIFDNYNSIEKAVTLYKKIIELYDSGIYVDEYFLIQSYRYLNSYYYNNNNINNVIFYTKKLLILCPNDKYLKRILLSLNH